MNHTDHVNLLRDGVPRHEGVWADLGAGTGAFTLALADLLGARGTIYAVDKHAGALREQVPLMRAQFPIIKHYTQIADFTGPLKLPPLDGIVMANALHFVKDKDPVLDSILGWLKPGGRLLLVEYGTDQGNPWVPFPFSYPTWEAMADAAGFEKTRLMARRASSFSGEIYSAVSFKPVA